MSYDVHVVRTEDWLDADQAPVTRADVDRLIAADPDLRWSESDFVDLKDDAGETTRYFAVQWKGASCFFWLGSEIACSNPEESQLVKLVEIATALDARVVGDDGECYSLGESAHGRSEIVTSE